MDEGDGRRLGRVSQLNLNCALARFNSRIEPHFGSADAEEGVTESVGFVTPLVHTPFRRQGISKDKGAVDGTHRSGNRYERHHGIHG